MLGLIARADDRGLGVMTLEVYRHLKPERVLVLDVPESPMPAHLDRYPGATVVRWSPARPAIGDAVLRRFLEGLDTVYTAETLYDPAVGQLAAELGVRVVLHAMPEFRRVWPGATTLEEWAPTPWRLDDFPPGTPVVPVPCAFPPPSSRPTTRHRLRVLHVAGNRAAADRNGTDVLRGALGKLNPDSRLELTIAVQRGVRPALGAVPRGVTVRFLEAVADRWELYADQDVLVMPRRYGGLCLPVQEAAAAGLALVMPDVLPNAWWPVLMFPAPSTAGHLKTAAGMIPVAEPDDTALARLLEVLEADHDYLEHAQRRAYEWAATHSWPALLPEYEARLRR